MLVNIKDGEPCVYFLQEDRDRLKESVIPRCKIGYTNRLDLSFKDWRMQIIRSTSPEKLNLIHIIKVPSIGIARKLEKFLQKYFVDRKSFDYSKEWFDLNEEDVRWIDTTTYESLKTMLHQNMQAELERLG